MAIQIGAAAPDFHLPSAQGPEIALGDFRGRRHVIIWFTKGLACPFCRRQVVQLAGAAGQIRGLETEILLVASTPPERAQVYHRRFSLPFLYLCDPAHGVARSWGLEVRPHSARRFLRGRGAVAGATPFDAAHPTPGEFQELLLDDDAGFFIVDRGGIVRYAIAGSYYSKAWQVPTNETLLTELRKLG